MRMDHQKSTAINHAQPIRDKLRKSAYCWVVVSSSLTIYPPRTGNGHQITILGLFVNAH